MTIEEYDRYKTDQIPGVWLHGQEFGDRFGFRWLGWRGHHDPKETTTDNDVLVGQWVARQKGNKEVIFYASYPGREGSVRRGSAFNIGPHDGQRILTASMPVGELNEARAECLSRLLGILREQVEVAA